MTPQAQLLVGAWEKRPWFFSSFVAIPSAVDSDLAEASSITERRSASIRDPIFFSFSLVVERVSKSKWWRKTEEEQANVEEIPNKTGGKVG